MPNMKSLPLTVLKVIVNVKVDNRQTNRQTNKQTGQKQYAPDHSIRGHKINRKFFFLKHQCPSCNKVKMGWFEYKCGRVRLSYQA